MEVITTTKVSHIFTEGFRKQFNKGYANVQDAAGC